MIKLNDICIQLYRLVPPRHGDASLTPWSTRLGPARLQHGKRSDGDYQIRGIDPRNGIGESDGRDVLPRCGSLVKIKNRSEKKQNRCVSSPDARVEQPLESTRRKSMCNVVKSRAVRYGKGVGGAKKTEKTELAHEFAITRAFYTPWKLTS